MKRIFSVLVLAVMITMACSAQKNNVPKAVADAFAVKFPDATEVRWGKENSKEYEAEFKLNHTDISANFGLDGSWKETEITIPGTQLPAAVINAVKAKYPGASVIRAEKIEKAGTSILYEVNIKVNRKKKELELDAGGKFVK